MTNRNQEGYPDPTASVAVKRVERVEKKQTETLLHCIQTELALMGYQLASIEMIDLQRKKRLHWEAKKE